MMPTVAIVAIAKNEARYIKEWIAFHLALGVEKILIYDNDSDDETVEVVASCLTKNVFVKRWPSVERFSPQRTAYADGLSKVQDCDWVAFVDIDEFIVPFVDGNLPRYLMRAPDHASAIAINWKTFGDSGLTDTNYGFVTESFKMCGDEKWGHNRHFKTIARPRAVSEMRIHHAVLSSGLLVDSNFQAVTMKPEGHTPVVRYSGIQLNHYQVKTADEFYARMSRGNANFPFGHPQHVRNDALQRFAALNNNCVLDERISSLNIDLHESVRSLWRNDGRQL